MAKFRFPGYDRKDIDPTEVNRILGNLQRESITFEGVVGDLARVIEGPFEGYPGLIEEIINERQVVRIRVNLFGRTTPLEIEFHAVAKVGKSF